MLQKKKSLRLKYVLVFEIMGLCVNLVVRNTKPSKRHVTCDSIFSVQLGHVFFQRLEGEIRFQNKKFYKKFVIQDVHVFVSSVIKKCMDFDGALEFKLPKCSLKDL